MKLIVGGAYQGKTDYGISVGLIREGQMAEGADCTLEALFSCQCMNHFHLWVKRALQAGWDLERLPERLLGENPGVVLITDELGCGIVPMDAFDREYRERHGRLCCRLAARAQQVHRVACGIGTVIKDG